MRPARRQDSGTAVRIQKATARTIAAVAAISCLTSQVLLAMPVAAKETQSLAQLLMSGDSLLNGGDIDGAIKTYSRAIKSNKKSAIAYQKRGQAEVDKSQFGKAISDLSQSIKLDPSQADSFSLRAKAYDSLKKYKDELNDLNTLIPMDSNNGTVWLQRAQVHAKLKHNKEVIEDCNHALPMGLQRDQLAALYSISAAAYKKLGKKTEYMQQMAKYESLMP